MKKLIWLSTLGVLLFSTPIFAQAPTKICVPNSNGGCQDVDSGNPFPVTATVSVGGFQSNGSYGTLTSTASTSASTAIPTGTPTTASLRITNNGTTEISCTFATGAATGLTNNTQIPANSSVVRSVGSFDHIACINQAGDSTSNSVVLESGTGLGNDSGSGNTGATNATIVGPLGQRTDSQGVSVTLPADQLTPIGSAGVPSTSVISSQGTNGMVPFVVTNFPGTASLVYGTTSAMTGTTSTQLIAAVSAKVLYVMNISCVNSHATVGTFVTVQDGSGGTTLGTLAAAAVFGGDEKHGVTPLFQTTAGNGLYVADVTTGANVICNASGYAQ